MQQNIRSSNKYIYFGFKMKLDMYVLLVWGMCGVC